MHKREKKKFKCEACMHCFRTEIAINNHQANLKYIRKAELQPKNVKNQAEKTKMT